MSKISGIDRLLISIAPQLALRRFRARNAAVALARHYDAATVARRTSGWARNSGDADATVLPALRELRMHSRDLVRNNAWAKRGLRTIANHTVGWGIRPKPVGGDVEKAAQLWKTWAEKTECDADGRHTFYGMQHLMLRSLVTDGEVFVRRRFRRPTDALTIPMQLQILEADFLDQNKNLLTSDSGGPIIQGVEFDLLGRRTAYWMFPEHPGSNRLKDTSKKIPADQIIHMFYSDRPGQTRGVSWFGSVIVPLKDFDEYEDATLMRQKIAACFAAFITDQDGSGGFVGEPSATDPLVEEFQPGMIVPLPPGKQVSFGNPPAVQDDSFSARNLRRIAAGLGVTYEDLTGDYSQVNFSSARMARLAHWANVYDWQEHMLIPTLCNGVWDWAMESALAAGEIKAAPEADWTVQPMPMIEPDKEGLAISRLVRNGVMTFSQMVREQGGDPGQHFAEYAADVKLLKSLGIQLDSNVADVSQAGLTQQRAGLSSGDSAAPPEKAKRSADDFEIDLDIPDDLARMVTQ